ncbi:MAG: lysophospholipid acyltransferase family protein [Thermoanaerobaculales bacterium]
MRWSAKRVRHEAGYLALRALLAGARLLPLPWLRALGRAVGFVVLRFFSKQRGRALTHLALAFPEHDEAWRRVTVARCARHLGTLLGEIGWLWSASPKAILARTEFVGLEHFTTSTSPSLGAMVITGHCGNWEWLNLALGAIGHPLTVAAREIYDPRLDEVARRLRGRFGGDTALRGQGAGTKLVGALRHGRSLGLLIDQDIAAPGVWVEFFGRPAWTPSGAALLALRTGAPMVPIFAARLPDGTMRVTAAPPIIPTRTSDLDATAAHLTAVLTGHIERQIREFPEQWVWLHKRWRHQPGEGETVWHADASTS